MNHCSVIEARAVQIVKSFFLTWFQSNSAQFSHLTENYELCLLIYFNKTVDFLEVEPKSYLYGGYFVTYFNQFVL